MTSTTSTTTTIPHPEPQSPPSPNPPTDSLAADAEAIAQAAERRLGKLNMLSGVMMKKLKASEARNLVLAKENERLREEVRLLGERLGRIEGTGGIVGGERRV